MIPWSMLRWQFFVRFLWLEAVIYTIMPLHLDWLIIPISDAYQAACCDDEPEIAYTEIWLANETHWFARWWLKRILHHLPLTILEEPRFDRRIYHKMGRDMWQIGRLYQFMSLCGLYSGMVGTYCIMLADNLCLVQHSKDVDRVFQAISLMSPHWFWELAKPVIFPVGGTIKPVELVIVK